jgi:hypothetical protein
VVLLYLIYLHHMPVPVLCTRRPTELSVHRGAGTRC